MNKASLLPWVKVHAKWGVLCLPFLPLLFLGWEIFFESLRSMLLAIVFFEVFLKGLLCQNFMPIKFKTAEPELWPASSQLELANYTLQLENLGFVQLTDYTSDINSTPKPIARLFSHPQELCFAEVGVVANLPISCSISGHLGNHWSLGVTNKKANHAVSYAFLRLPKRLEKYVEDSSPSRLFEAFLTWRRQISQGLHLKPMQNVQAETYFQKEQEAQTNTRRAFLRKSMIWGIIEMFWCSHNPQTEWLGDYRKLM